MNIKIKIVLTIITTLVSFVAGAQNENQLSDTSKKISVKADANTKFYNDKKEEISLDEFKKAQETGKYSLAPSLGPNNKLVALTLVSTNKMLSEGWEAKPFLAKNMNGKIIKLADLKGKVLVINFWFTACVPCIAEIPELNKLVDDYKNNKNVIFLAPTFENKKMVQQFLIKNKFKYSILQESESWIDDYGITSFPSHMVVDKAGTIAFASVNSGAKVINALQKTIEELLVKNVKRINQASLPNKIVVIGGEDELITGMFSMTSKTVIIDEAGNKLTNKEAGELMNNAGVEPYRRKTKDGEIIVLKKVKK